MIIGTVMADFEPAFRVLMRWEDSTPSGKVTHDTGGRTRFGISENANQMPDNFWTDPPEVAINEAMAVCQQKYWKFDGIQNQNIANKCLDLVFNAGHNGTKIIQKCAGVAQDGVYGPETERAINAQDSLFLLLDMRKEQSDYYTHLAEMNPRYMAYLHGWLRRAAA